MHRPDELTTFLETVPDRTRSYGDISNLQSTLLENLGFDEYTLDEDAEGSIADAIVRHRDRDLPVIALQYGYNPEADEVGPRIPGRPARVDYSVSEQILATTSASYVVSLTNTMLSIVGEGCARTIVLPEIDHSLDNVPTYQTLSEDSIKEILDVLHTESGPVNFDEKQRSLSDY